MANGATQTLSSLVKQSSELFFAELSNLILWLVVFFAAGIGFYFSLYEEPSVYLVSSLSAASFACVLLFRKHSVAYVSLLPIFFFSLGLTVATLRTQAVWSEKLTTKVADAKVYGVVEKIFPSENKSARFLLKVKRLYADEKILVKRLQVTSTNFNNAVRVGDFISFYASLSPPSKRLFPHGYDFARHAYFNEIGGSAFSISKIKVIEAGADDSLMNKIENLRIKIFNKLIAELGQANGGIASALMIGEQKIISQSILEDMRRSGLSHILSVSGLHLSLVSIICFFIVRHLLSYSVRISQQYNTKKIAAYISLIVSFAYLLISGLQVAAVRSFIMLAALIVSILIDRQDYSKRSVFLAAFLILFFSPETLLYPSFQMSFSAVLALVGVYEIYSKRILVHHGSHASIFRRIKFYFMGVLASSVIAGMATSIFVIYHFHNYSNYSVFANLLVAPVVSFVIMPSVILTFALMPLPFGICKLGLYPLNFGITLLLKVAKYVTTLPKATVLVPTIPAFVPVLFTCGLLWLCIWEKKWRVIGLAPMLVALIIIALTPFPDIVIDQKYKAVLLTDGANENSIAQITGPKRTSKFHKTQWFSLLNPKQQVISDGPAKLIKGLYEIKSELQSFPNMCTIN